MNIRKIVIQINIKDKTINTSENRNKFCILS